MPQKFADEVLFASDHTCCLCRTKGKDVQVHHIDGDVTHNSPDNLAVLCLDCHSRITGPRGLGRSFSAGELTRYKKSWDHQVQVSRGVHQPDPRYQDQLLAQIDMVFCEIISCSPTSRRACQLLDTIFNLHIWRGGPEIDKKIVEGLWHLALMMGSCPGTIGIRVAEMLWEMCFEFVVPEDVPMEKAGEQRVLSCLEGLRILADFNSQFGHSGEVAHAIAESVENFFQTAVSYSQRKIANAAIAVLDVALAGCYEQSQLRFPDGRMIFRGTVNKLQKILKQTRPRWTYQRRRLNRVLDKCT